MRSIQSSHMRKSAAMNEPRALRPHVLSAQHCTTCPRCALDSASPPTFSTACSNSFVPDASKTSAKPPVRSHASTRTESV
eukprot:6212320-Pleurochrysis_carterae.AAC.2